MLHLHADELSKFYGLSIVLEAQPRHLRIVK
jgi:hypothetical protein